MRINKWTGAYVFLYVKGFPAIREIFASQGLKMFGGQVTVADLPKWIEVCVFLMDVHRLVELFH